MLGRKVTEEENLTLAHEIPKHLREKRPPPPEPEICEELKRGARRTYYFPGQRKTFAAIDALQTASTTKREGGPRSASCMPALHSFRVVPRADVRMVRAGPGYESLLKFGWKPDQAIGIDMQKRADTDVPRMPLPICTTEEKRKFKERARQNDDKHRGICSRGHIDDAFE
ncbi:hypothetical protein HDU89_007953 [Geranomyces variabilis]|nr:hypothetical protein HDU89_007953 [Geranomyces variabilis]